MLEPVDEQFRRQAEATPAAVAIDRGSDSVSYALLEERARKLAGLLVGAGLGPGALVAILSEDRVNVVAALLACLRTRCVFVPLDPDLPPRRLALLLRTAPPEGFLVDTRWAGRLGMALPPESGEVALGLLDDGDLPGPLDPRLRRATVGDPPAPTPWDPEAHSYVYFTSGSTGVPKAIAGRAKGISHFIRWEIETFEIDASARVSQLTTPSFDAFLRDVFTPLCAGGTVCLPPAHGVSLSPADCAAWLETARVTHLHCVPTLFRALIGQPLAKSPFPVLRHVLLAGEPLLPADVERWLELTGESVPLTNLYGPSETTMVKLFHRVLPSDAARPSVPIGKAMPGARAMVFDPKGRPAPPGVVGEIFIRTPYRSLGYFRRPDLTLAAFVPNPLSEDPHDLLYKTGDMGRFLDDGALEFLGRKDRQVKVRGVRVELSEIERTAREHQSVQDVAVIDLEEPSGGTALAGFFVFHPAVEVSELHAFLSERLPSAMVPATLRPIDLLPRTINGKLDRAALLRLTTRRPEAGRPFTPPTTPTEHALAAIWEQLLSLHAGVHDDFFSVGGHSLLAMQVVSRVESEFGIPVSLQEFLERPTISELAKRVEEALLGVAGDDAELLAEIENLDDGDVERLLGQ